jgi:predicted nuclease of restriction endonuclease-like (RecB) superfamily
MKFKKSIRRSRSHYPTLLRSIGRTLEHAKQNAVIAINNQLVKANWEIGRQIVEFEQGGKQKAEYGSELLGRLSRDLKKKFGKGFSRTNIYNCRQFYLSYPIFQTLSGKLSWSHYSLLLGISNGKSREFYLEQSVSENWSVRELDRQVSASLFERMMLSRNRKQMLSETKKRKIIKTAHDIVKDPYVLDFLDIKGKPSEKYLEQKIIDNLQLFLLELGKGFAFVARQFKIHIGTKHHFVDLVFYHRILKCFVLFDIKTRPVEHKDVGQMNMYLNYFKAEENAYDDNNPIGIILSADKTEILVKYALGGLSNKIFVSKYQLYLPDRKELEKQVREYVVPGIKKLKEVKQVTTVKKLPQLPGI